MCHSFPTKNPWLCLEVIYAGCRVLLFFSHFGTHERWLFDEVLQLLGPFCLGGKVASHRPHKGMRGHTSRLDQFPPVGTTPSDRDKFKASVIKKCPEHSGLGIVGTFAQIHGVMDVFCCFDYPLVI